MRVKVVFLLVTRLAAHTSEVLVPSLEYVTDRFYFTALFTSDASFVLAGSRESEAPVKLRHKSTSFRAKSNFLFSVFDANHTKHAVFV